jgi:hypothetical protein
VAPSASGSGADHAEQPPAPSLFFPPAPTPSPSPAPPFAFRAPPSIFPAPSEWHHYIDFDSLSEFVWCENGFEFNAKMAAISWNASALFGAINGIHARQVDTFNEFGKILLSADVSFVQEAHGYDEDRDSLRRECSSHLHFGSAHASPNSGGLLTSICKVFARCFTRAATIIIEQGRCLATFLTGPLGNLCLINIHVEPLKTAAQKIRLFRRVMEAIPPANIAVTFMGGDMNMSLDAADRVSLENGVVHGASDPIANAFGEIFRDLLEVAQSDYTRRQVRHGSIVSLSKIDRWFTSLSSIDLLDRSAIAATTMKVTNMKFPSDHVPVLLRIEATGRSPPQTASIPRWITDHPGFPGCLHETLLEHGHGPRCPGAALEHFKDVIMITVGKMKHSSVYFGQQSIAAQLYWATILLRSAREGPIMRDSRVLMACPSLNEFIGDCNFCDTAALRAKITLLAANDVEALITDNDANLNQPEWRRMQRRAALRNKAAMWAPLRKRITLHAIRREDGSVCASAAESAEELRRHWAPTFERKDIDNSAAASFAGFVQVAPELNWAWEDEDYARLIKAAPDGMPGPDGITYGAYAAAGEHGVSAIKRAFEDFIGGSELQPGFNTSNSAFIPKVAPDGDGIFATVTAADTRPLQLSNTVSKLFASLLNQHLARVASIVCIAIQKGFLQGRSIADCIIETDSVAADWFRRGYPSAALILFDFRAAFPSLAHDFIFLVLESMKIPAHIIKAIRRLYENCIMHICFGKQVHCFLAILAGIKMGCPLSGTLFALALDPFLRAISSAAPSSGFHASAFADDLAMALRNIYADLPRLLSLFVLLSKAACLSLNGKKIVVVPYSFINEARLRTWIREFCTLIGNCLIKRHAVYLGATIGPDAAAHRGLKMCETTRVRTLDIKQLGLGLMANTKAFNTRVMPLASYQGQFYLHGKMASDTFAWSAQMLYGGPWNAVPLSVLLRLKDMGTSFEFADVHCANQAAMFRCSFRNDSYSAAAVRDAVEPSDNELLHGRTDEWLQSTVFFQMRAVREALVGRHRQEMQEVLSRPLLSKTIQKEVHAILRDARTGTSVVATFQRRIAYWEVSSATCFNDLENAVRASERIVFLNSALHYSCAMAVVRTICNGWCTAARFHSEPRACCFCGLLGGDDLRHFVLCSTIVRLFDDNFDEVLIMHVQDSMLRFLGFFPFILDADRCKHAVLLDALLHLHQSNAGRFRHVDEVRRGLSAILRALSRRDPRVRAIAGHITIA